MRLSDLAGRRWFSGIEEGVITEKDGWGDEQDCKCVKFVLDEVCYMAIEDPEDGWRSHCKELRVSEQKPLITFPAVPVIAEHRTEGLCGTTDDLLVLRDELTGEVVLEIGPCNTSDYYPYFDFYYHPEGMSCNTARVVVDDLL